jgi:hypothetical protein
LVFKLIVAFAAGETALVIERGIAGCGRDEESLVVRESHASMTDRFSQSVSKKLGELRQVYELLPPNEKHKKPASIERARGEHW